MLMWKKLLIPIAIVFPIENCIPKSSHAVRTPGLNCVLIPRASSDDQNPRPGMERAMQVTIPVGGAVEGSAKGRTTLRK